MRLERARADLQTLNVKLLRHRALRSTRGPWRAQPERAISGVSSLTFPWVVHVAMISGRTIGGAGAMAATLSSPAHVKTVSATNAHTKIAWCLVGSGLI